MILERLRFQNHIIGRRACQLAKSIFSQIGSSSNEGNGAVKRFGEKLRALRLRQGYTTRQLANLLAVSHTHVIGIENGKRGVSTELVLRIADLFQVTIDELMRDEFELD